MSRNTVVLQFATQLEAKPFIETLQLTQLQQKPFLLFRGDSSLYVIIGGIGIPSAAIAATYVCTMFNVGILLNIGAAGALNTSLPLGTIVTVTTVYDTSRFSFYNDKPFTYTLTPMNDLPKLSCVSMAKPLHTDEQRQQFSSIADIVDMELAGIAQASQTFSIQCYAIKYVTDTAEHNTHEKILKNIITLSQSTSGEIITHVQSLLVTHRYHI
ncbi:MAG: 5'-methylthioadenosine/S-adenosylhomocysteine nucleosidase family protein [Spirochaetota bacterium]